MPVGHEPGTHVGIPAGKLGRRPWVLASKDDRRARRGIPERSRHGHLSGLPGRPNRGQVGLAVRSATLEDVRNVVVEEQLLTRHTHTLNRPRPGGATLSP